MLIKQVAHPWTEPKAIADHAEHHVEAVAPVALDDPTAQIANRRPPFGRR